MMLTLDEILASQIPVQLKQDFMTVQQHNSIVSSLFDDETQAEKTTCVKLTSDEAHRFLEAVSEYSLSSDKCIGFARFAGAELENLCCNINSRHIRI